MLSRAPGSHPRARWFWQVLLANMFCSEAYHQNLFTLSQLDKREWVLGLGGGGPGVCWAAEGTTRAPGPVGTDAEVACTVGRGLSPRGPSPRGAAAFRAPPQGELPLSERALQQRSSCLLRRFSRKPG